MKYLRNEKGVTLTELLAALMISAMVLGGAMLALWQINQLFQSSTEGYLHRSEMKRVSSVFSTRLADSSTAVYISAADELRMLSGGKRQAVVFDRNSGTLSVYDFNGDVTQFESTAVSRAALPELYEQAQVVAESISGVAYTYANGSPLPAAPLKNGELISVTLTFEGGDTETVTVKLLQDRTDK